MTMTVENCKAIVELAEDVAQLKREVGVLLAIADTKVYTSKDAAQYLGIAVSTLRRYKEMGLVTPIVGTTKYSQAALDRYAAKRKK